MRVGIGFDVHRLVVGRPLIIGGVDVPHSRGLLGHSDADVLLHAIADALLGAASLGDLGTHFPDTREEWKDADSRKLLAGVVRILAQAGYRPHNVDATVVLERPRLRPHTGEMCKTIARCLGIDTNAVSVKATTNEGLGFIGHGDAAAAYAVCTIMPIREST